MSSKGLKSPVLLYKTWPTTRQWAVYRWYDSLQQHGRVSRQPSAVNDRGCKKDWATQTKISWRSRLMLLPLSIDCRMTSSAMRPTFTSKYESLSVIALPSLWRLPSDREVADSVCTRPDRLSSVLSLKSRCSTFADEDDVWVPRSTLTTANLIPKFVCWHTTVNFWPNWSGSTGGRAAPADVTEEWIDELAADFRFSLSACGIALSSKQEVDFRIDWTGWDDERRTRDECDDKSSSSVYRLADLLPSRSMTSLVVSGNDVILAVCAEVTALSFVASPKKCFSVAASSRLATNTSS